MTLRIIKRARAKQDVIELADTIARDNLEAAERFIDAAEAAFRFLAETPAAGMMKIRIEVIRITRPDIARLPCSDEECGVSRPGFPAGGRKRRACS